MAAAVCGMVAIGSTSPGRPDPEFTALAEEALAALSDVPSPIGLRLLALLAGHLRVGVDAARGYDLAGEALTQARALGERVTLGRVLVAAAWARLGPSNLDERLAIAEELLSVGRATGHTVFTVAGLEHRAVCHRELGDVIEMRRQLAELDSRGAMSLVSLALRANDALLRGDLATASARAEEIGEVARGLYVHPSTWYGPLALGIRSLQDRMDEFVPVLERAASRPGFGASSAAALAVAHARAGRLDEASRVLAPHATTAFDGVPENLGWSIAMAYFAEAVALVGDRGAAAVLSSRLEPLAGRLADAYAVVVTSIDHVRALLVLTAGDHARAAEIAEGAAARSRARATPILLARELIVLAAARTRLAAPVAHLVAEAVSLGDTAGARVVRTDAARLGVPL